LESWKNEFPAVERLAERVELLRAGNLYRAGRERLCRREGEEYRGGNGPLHSHFPLRDRDVNHRLAVQRLAGTRPRRGWRSSPTGPERARRVSEMAEWQKCHMNLDYANKCSCAPNGSMVRGQTWLQFCALVASLGLLRPASRCNCIVECRNEGPLCDPFGTSR
jgi:hypothetical protein